MSKILAVIRVRGVFGVRKEIKDTLKMLNLDKPNRLSIYKETPSILGMLRKASSYITWGEIDKDTFKELIQKRGVYNEHILKNKFGSIDDFVNQFFNDKTSFQEIGLKNKFKLNPPRKGYKSIKYSYPKGALGYRGDNINELIRRML